jgi:hypothetical protein
MMSEEMLTTEFLAEICQDHYKAIEEVIGPMGAQWDRGEIDHPDHMLAMLLHIMTGQSIQLTLMLAILLELRGEKHTKETNK